MTTATHQPPVAAGEEIVIARETAGLLGEAEAGAQGRAATRAGAHAAR